MWDRQHQGPPGAGCRDLSDGLSVGARPATGSGRGSVLLLCAPPWRFFVRDWLWWGARERACPAGWTLLTGAPGFCSVAGPLGCGDEFPRGSPALLGCVPSWDLSGTTCGAQSLFGWVNNTIAPSRLWASYLMSLGLSFPIPMMVPGKPSINIIAAVNEAGQMWAVMWFVLAGETSVHPGTSSLPVFVS